MLRYRLGDQESAINHKTLQWLPGGFVLFKALQIPWISMPFLTFQDLFLLRVFLDLKQFIRHKLWCPPKCVPFALFNHFSLSYSPCLVIGRTNLSNKTLMFHDFQGPTVKFDDSPGLENEMLKFHDFPRFPWPVRTLLVDFAKTTPCQMRTRKCAERTLDSQFAALPLANLVISSARAPSVLTSRLW